MKVDFLAVFAYVAAALTWNVRSLHCTHITLQGTEEHNCGAVQCFHTCTVFSLDQNTMALLQKTKTLLFPIIISQHINIKLVYLWIVLY